MTKKKSSPTTYRCTCGWEGKPRRRSGFEPMCAKCGNVAEPVRHVPDQDEVARLFEEGFDDPHLRILGKLG